MAVTISAKLQPSATVDYGIAAIIQGYTGDLTQLFMVVGTSALNPPTVAGDLSAGLAAAFNVLSQVFLTVQRAAGQNVIQASEDWTYQGSVGDSLWVAVAQSASYPVGPTVPLLAVAGPFTVQL